MTMFIRECKHGGFSECSCPDELVGKRRCIHVPGKPLDISIEKIDRGSYRFDIGEANVDIKGAKKDISKFFSSVKELDEETTNKILDILENE